MDTRILLAATAPSAGAAMGLGVFTFAYAKGASYLGSDPKACANCHVMNDQMAGWQVSSHRAVAGCNDCHAPHDLLGKYFVKAKNGFFHSLYFTTGRFHEPIAITPSNRAVTEAQCRHCHQPIVDAIDHEGHGGQASDTPMECIHCHRSVGHLH